MSDTIEIFQSVATFSRRAAALLLLLFIPGMASAQGTDHDVIIVGAGSSGLYAAYELNNMGFDVLVLEGRPRHGGRLSHQTVLGTTSTDEFAEGLTGNDSLNWHYNDIMAHDSNRLVEIMTESRNDDLLWSVGGNTVLGWDVGSKSNPEIYDYWDFYYSATDNYSGPDIDIETHLCSNRGVCRGDDDFHLYVNSYPGGEMTTPLDTMGMRSLATQESLWMLGYGEFAFANSTWLDTLDELYFNSVLGNVVFQAQVTEVDTSGAYPVVTAYNCSNCHGSHYPGGSPPEWHSNFTNPPAISAHTAKAVLIAVGLGVLKNADITFTPPLSAGKQNAIDNLGFGNGGKLFLQFSNRFWPTKVTAFMTEGGHCGYAWSQKYKGGDGDAVLVCFSVGENAENLDLLADDNARITAALSDLDGMYAGTPFSDAFVDGYWKRTDDQRHNHGTYSYPTVGSYPTDGSPSLREDLAAPEGTLLYFGGESTSNNHPATVVGAMEAGLRAAGEIDADHTPTLLLPEPASTLQLISGILGLFVLNRRRSRQLAPPPARSPGY